MDEKGDKHLKDLKHLLSESGDKLNILEEEIDLSVQKEYFLLVERLVKHNPNFKKLSARFVEELNELFDESVDLEKKKEMLVVLSTLNDISVYRSIESFYKTDSPLKKWAVIALQQSRMLIQSNLLDDPGIFISTGLGGHGRLLRYFCVFLNKERNTLRDFQQNIVRTETEQALKKVKGEIEQVEFREGYNTLLLLLPLNTDLKALFGEIVDECNTYGHFLHNNIIVTNVKKLTDAEISKIVHQKKDDPDTDDIF